VATENKDQEPETASATLADGMHFVGNIEGFRIDLDAEESVGGVGAGPQPPRLLDAISPTNFAFINPQVLHETIK